MRWSGRKMLLLGALALFAVAAVAGCQNPLDPLDRSEKIQGLSFIDFTATWDRWDSDPEFDGVIITMDYKNEFNDALSFHDKPHTLVVEFWTQKEEGPEDEIFTTRDKLIYSRSITYSNSDDDIRIPVESYLGSIREAGLDLSPEAGVEVYVLMRVFPPQEYPRPELQVAQTGVVVFKRPTVEDEPNR